jgi:hypothetical protein
MLKRRHYIYSKDKTVRSALFLKSKERGVELREFGGWKPYLFIWPQKNSYVCGVHEAPTLRGLLDIIAESTTHA